MHAPRDPERPRGVGRVVRPSAPDIPQEPRPGRRPPPRRGVLRSALAAALALLAPAPRALAARPGRIVALAPSCAEILFALGAAPRVVGVSDAAKTLPEAQGKPALGGFSPDLERVAALKPDLVVVSKDGTDRAAFERLKGLGYRVAVTSADSLDGVLADVRAVGAAIGEEARAGALAKELGARIAAAEERARRRGSAPRALALIWPDPPVAAGPATFVGDLLRRAGAGNPVPASAGLWPRLSLETLAAFCPEVLVVPDADESRDVFRRALAAPGLRELAAVKKGNVIRIPGDWIERPGPRLVNAFERLVERLAETR